MLAALNSDSYLNEPYESFDRNYYLDEGIYPESQYARHAVVDVDPIKSESKKRKGKGGGLARREKNYVRLGQERGAVGKRMANEEVIAQQLINKKLEAQGRLGRLQMRQLGRGAVAAAGVAGLGGLAINALQEDELGNAYAKPIFDAGLATALGVGGGGLIGANTAPLTRDIPLANNGAALRQTLPANEILAARRTLGMRGAYIGGAGGALLALAAQLRNMDQGRQDELRGY